MELTGTTKIILLPDFGQTDQVLRSRVEGHADYEVLDVDLDALYAAENLSQMIEMFSKYLREDKVDVIGNGVGATLAWAAKARFPQSVCRCLYLNPILPFKENVTPYRWFLWVKIPFFGWCLSFLLKKAFRRRLLFLTKSNWRYWAACSFREEKESHFVYSTGEPIKKESYQRLARHFYGIKVCETKNLSEIQIQKYVGKFIRESRKRSANSDVKRSPAAASL